MYGCIDTIFVSQTEFDCVSRPSVHGKKLLEEAFCMNVQHCMVFNYLFYKSLNIIVIVNHKQYFKKFEK
jgi:hypothetical protein